MYCAQLNGNINRHPTSPLTTHQYTQQILHCRTKSAQGAALTSLILELAKTLRTMQRISTYLLVVYGVCFIEPVRAVADGDVCCNECEFQSTGVCRHPLRQASTS